MKHWILKTGIVILALVVLAESLWALSPRREEVINAQWHFLQGIDNPTTRWFILPLAAAFIDGTGIIGNDGTTAPGLAETDNVPAIVYATSAETTKIQWTFPLPADYSTGLGFRVLLSSSDASGANQSIDWQLWVNDDAAAFCITPISQAAVGSTCGTLDTTNDVLTLTMNATGETAVSTGSLITLDIWSASSSNGTTEIKGVYGLYTATQ